MQIIIEEFKGSCFVYNYKKHFVKDAKIVNGNAVIKTNRQTFVKTQTELDEFYNDVKFVTEALVALNEEYVPIVSESTSLSAEIIQANSLSSHITAKLLIVFNELSDKPTEETYKKSDAMVKASNAIAKVQITNYKYLTLK